MQAAKDTAKRVSIIIALLLTLFGLPVTTYAVDANAGGDGNSGVDGGTWDYDKQGYRVSVVKPDGSLVTSKDLVWGNHSGTEYRTMKLKNGAATHIENIHNTDLLSYNMPPPLSPDGNGNIVGNGTRLREWMLSAGEDGGIGHLVGTLFNGAIPIENDMSGVTASSHPMEICVAGGYYILVEPVFWFEPIDSSGNRMGAVLYASVSEWAEIHSYFGFDTGGNMSILTNRMGPFSLTVEHADQIGEYAISMVRGFDTNGFLFNSEIISYPPSITGYGLQIYFPGDAPAATHTWDYPLGNSPGPAPEPPAQTSSDPDDPGGSIFNFNIVKFYVDILELDGVETEIPVGNYIREHNPPTIAIETEDEYQLTNWHTSVTYYKPTNQSELYEEVRDGMTVSRSGTSPFTILMEQPETTVYLKLVRGYDSSTPNIVPGDVVIEQSQVSVAIDTHNVSGKVTGWGPRAATFHCDDMSGSHIYVHNPGCQTRRKANGSTEYYCDGHECTYVLNDSDFHYYHENTSTIDATIQAENVGGIFAPVLTGDQSGDWGITGGGKAFSSFRYESVIWRGYDIPTMAAYKHPASHELLALTQAYGNITQHKRILNQPSYNKQITIAFGMTSGSDTYTDSAHGNSDCPQTESIAISSNHANSWPTYTANVLVKIYAGTPGAKSVGNDTNGSTLEFHMDINGTYTNHASGRMKQAEGNQKYFPYIRMTYQKTQQYDPNRTEVYMLSEYLSEVNLNSYAEAGWYQANDGKNALTMKSQQWSGHQRANTLAGGQTNSVLPQGAIYQLDTGSANLKVKVAAYQPIIGDATLRQAMEEAGTDTSEYALGFARGNFDDYEATAIDVLEHLRVVQWVNSTTSSLSANPFGSGATKISEPGQTLGGQFDAQKANAEDKYMLKADSSADGRDSHAIQGDLDINKVGMEEIFYRVYADVWGDIYFSKGTSETGIYSTRGRKILSRTDFPADVESRLSGEALEIEQKTKLISNFITALERNAGADTSETALSVIGGRWYNEAWDGLVIVKHSATFDVGFIYPEIRSAALDPALGPKQSSQQDMLTKGYISAFRVNDKADNHMDKPSEYIGEFKGMQITMKDMEHMLQSKTFIIPNASVSDIGYN